MTKTEFFFYCLDIPTNLLEGSIRGSVLAFIFSVLNFFDKYIFGASYSDSFDNTTVFFANTILPLVLLFSALSFILRWTNRANFFKNYTEESQNPIKIHIAWRSQFK